MLPGPVFKIEMIAISRRARYYVLRSCFGIAVLVLIFLNYQELVGFQMTMLTRAQAQNRLGRFASSTFLGFAGIQAAALLLLTPAVLAPVIAVEKERKTLLYLLASRLSGSEIVLGKLAARLLHIGVFLATGVPIFSLLSLFGGVDPIMVLSVYAATASSIFFVAALSLLVSTLANRARDAIGAAYLLVLAWLLLPTFLTNLLPASAYRDYPWIFPLVATYYPSINLWELYRLGPVVALTPWVTICLVQTLYGLVFVLVSVIALRRLSRTDGGTPRPSFSPSFDRWLRRRRRPACGDRPMIWKELHRNRPKGLLKWVGLVVGAGLGGLFLMNAYPLMGQAFETEPVQARPAGRFGSISNTQASNWRTLPFRGRDRYHEYLRSYGIAVYSLWILCVAAASACSVAGERDQDTWISLIATDLSGGEILRAKMLGALRRGRWLAAILLILWLSGLITRTLHPVGFLLAVLGLAAFTWYAVALGICVSMFARTSTRSLAVTIGTLIMINGGYQLWYTMLRPEHPAIWLTCTPYLEAGLLLSPDEFNHLLTHASPGRAGGWGWDEQPIFCMAGIVIHALLALGLTGFAFRSFESRANRLTSRFAFLDRMRRNLSAGRGRG